MTINERIEAGQRERWVLTRVCRAGWRLEQAERERTWALASARAEGISIRTLATAIGLSPSRVHQIVAAADLDALDAALGELRAAGWPAPEDPDAREGGADWRTRSSWPSTSHGCRRSSTASPPTWTNSPGPGGSSTWTPPRCWPTPDLEFRAFCARRRLPASSTPQLERASDAWQAERYQRGEIDQRPGYTGNPFRPR